MSSAPTRPVSQLYEIGASSSQVSGTLTTNEMTVTHVYAVDDLIDLSPYLHHTYESRNHGRDVFRPPPAFQKAALVGNLCNNAFRNEHGVNIGQPTEVALLNVLPILGVEDSRKVRDALRVSLTGRNSRKRARSPSARIRRR